ncbi:hypothetical protein FQR65_LT00378 [Abscondita terminalis]|nr:hypothetical protein FQR65_LT00378 [Abscondita terminalis]
MSKPFVPLICNNTSYGNIDYGIPIVANKWTDYRTTTGTHHRFIPTFPQDFDCRVKARIKQSLKTSSPEIRDATTESVSKNSLEWKFKNRDGHIRYPKCKRAEEINHLRSVQEKLFRNPPPVKPLNLSETKETYIHRYVKFPEREVFPPEPYAICKISALGRDEQPAVRPEQRGYWKLTDPYVSTTRATYVPFTINQQNGIAKKDIITYYDASNLPKGKGFGPQEGPIPGKLVPSKALPMRDPRPFRRHPFNKYIHESEKRVPNFGKTSETKASYVRQSFSEFLPYIFQPGVEFPDSLAKSSPWQDLAPPGMYCTEYCHIGSQMSVNSIIENLPPHYAKHIPCYAKFCDWNQ